MLGGLAGLADAGDLDHLTGTAEASRGSERDQRGGGGRIDSLGDVVTAYAQHEDADFIASAPMMPAGNKGVQAFDPMHRPRINQFRQRAIHLKRRA